MDDTATQGAGAAARRRGRAAPRRVPADRGHYRMRIARDGTWFHCGTPIRRPALVRLFASALRRDAGGDYWLETPAERGRIDVDDAPFVAVDVDVAGHGHDQRLTFRTNVGERVTAGPAHPLAVATSPVTGLPAPYVDVRDGLAALVARPVYYELAGLCEPCPQDGGVPGVWSCGHFFALGGPEPA